MTSGVLAEAGGLGGRLHEPFEERAEAVEIGGFAQEEPGLAVHDLVDDSADGAGDDRA